MPKSQKQKKAKVADFTKRRLKLGKGKQVASNATNTSYSAKTIELAHQNIGVDKGDAPVTRRNQTLDDLLVLLRHYSPNSRRDALLGLREILNAHVDLHKAHLGAIVTATARLASDDDASVRKGLRTFYGWFLPLVDKNALAPFLPSVLFFCTTALSNIFPEVRLDAIPIIDLLLDLAPEKVVDGSLCAGPSTGDPHAHGRTILTAYLSLLSVGEASVNPGIAAHSGAQLSPTAKLAVLKALSRLLSIALQGASRDGLPEAPTWFLADAFASDADFRRFLQIFPSGSHGFQGGRRNEPVWRTDAIPADIASTHTHLVYTYRHLFADSSPSSAGLFDQETEPARAAETPLSLWQTLKQLLLSTFLEAAPLAFTEASLSRTSLGASDTPLETVWAVGCIARDLWRRIDLDTTEAKDRKAELKALSTLVDKFGAYFVFGGEELRRRDAKSQAQLQDINLIYCELVALLALKSRTSPTPKLDAQLRQVGQYVVSLLKLEDASHGRISASAYAAMLPTVWSLISRVPDEGAVGVFAALLDHFGTLGASSSSKSLCGLFLARICLMEDLSGCDSPVKLKSLPADVQQKLSAWFKSLPRYLFDLGSKDLSATAVVLTFLHRAASMPLLRFAEDLPGLAPLLVPYFAVARSNGTVQPGPYARLPASLQALADGLAFYVSEEAEGEGERLSDAVALSKRVQ